MNATAPADFGNTGWPARIALAFLFLAAPCFALATRRAEPPLALYFGAPVVLAQWGVIACGWADGFRLGPALRSLSPLARMALALWLVAALAGTLLIAPDRAKAVLHLIITLGHGLFGLVLCDRLRGAWSGAARGMAVALAAGAMAYFAIVWGLVFAERATPDFTWALIGAGASNVRQLGFYGLPLLGLAAGLAATAPQASARAGWCVAAMLGFFLVFWSGGRANAGAAAVSVAVVLWLCGQAQRTWLALGLLAAAVAGAALSEVLKPSDLFGFLSIVERTSDFGGDYSSRRMDIWLGTLPGILDSPLVGHGEGQFRSGVAAALGRINHPHNAAVQYLYQWGMVGTLGAAGLFWALLSRARSALAIRREAALPALAALAGLLAMSLLEGSLFHVYPVAMVAACLAIVAASAGHRHYTQAR